MDAGRVLGLEARSQTEAGLGGREAMPCLTSSPRPSFPSQGRLGNFEKSGLRFSTNAFLPSCPSSVM